MSVQTRFIRRSLVVVSLLAWTATAMAQTAPEKSEPRGPEAAEGGPWIGGMGGIGILRSEGVQDELKLTNQQKTRVEEFLNRVRTELRARVDRLRDVSDEERRKQAEELEEQLKKEAPERALKIRREIESILQPDQLKRFRQIELRREGPWTLLRPDVVEALALTDAQKEQIDQISRETQQKMRDVFREARQSEKMTVHYEQARRLGAKVEQARREGQKNAAKVLSREQLEKLVELMGEPLGSSALPFAPRRAADRKPPEKQPVREQTGEKQPATEPPAQNKPVAKEQTPQSAPPKP